MKEYLALISLIDFDKLFKNGRLQLGQSHVVFVPVPFNKVREMPSLFDQLANGICDFELPFELIILHYQKDSFDLNSIINIGEVKGLYPLNEEAKRRIVPRLDSRVYVNEPLWPKKVQEFIEGKRFESSMRGIDNVRNIFGIKKKEFKECSKIIDNDIIKVVLDNAYSGTSLLGRPLEERSLWVYLMRYRRYSMFPKNASGFILDSAYVEFLYEHGGDTNEASQDIDQSSLCKDMYGQSENSLAKLIQYVEEHHPKFAEYTDSIVKDFHVAAPVYCMLIETAGDSFLDLDVSVNGIPLQDIVKELLMQFPKATNLALYMLGAVLGYEKTYDALYKKERLALFKKDEVSPFRGKRPTDGDTKKGKNNLKETTLDFGNV